MENLRVVEITSEEYLKAFDFTNDNIYKIGFYSKEPFLITITMTTTNTVGNSKKPTGK